MRRLKGKVTYANVISTLCLFLLLGGGAALAAGKLGKNSVGTSQLKNSAVTESKIANGAISGSKINLSSLGTVPNATHSGSADTASHASSADSATHANSADSAGLAEAATNAAHLGGSPPSAYRDSCPAGTQLRTPELCEGTTIEGHVTLNEALAECAAAGLRLPSPSEAESLQTEIYAVWTDDFWTNGAISYALTYTASSHSLVASESGEEASRVCVTTPINN
jgi:hypothetical protein